MSIKRPVKVLDLCVDGPCDLTLAEVDACINLAPKLAEALRFQLCNHAAIKCGLQQGPGSQCVHCELLAQWDAATGKEKG